MARNELADIRPAPYALPPGTPALQNPPHHRRLLASLALSTLLVAGTAGFLMGRSQLPAAHLEARGDIWTEDLAHGPLAALLAQHRRFLQEARPGEAYWHGVRRLLRSALTDEEHPEAELMSRLQQTIAQGDPPDDIRRLLPLLDHRLQRSRQARPGR